MKCKRCGNTDNSYFYQGSKGIYCRKCIRFNRILLEEELGSFDYDIALGVQEYAFSYNLTSRQKQASQMCADYAEDSDVLLHCVCGAGKTEIAVESISRYLAKGKKVAYAIARKEVVIELTKRFEAIFPKAKVVGVYGGHHNELTGDLIVCTCHQLYRYYKTFDLLILDEVDAFPLKGDETLMNISLNSCRGNIIFSTATIDDDLRNVLNKRSYKTVRLFKRPSGRNLPIPKVIYLPKLISYIYLYYLLRKIDGQCIVFVQSKKQAKMLHTLYSRFLSCTYVYSDLNKRDENIQAFKNKEYSFIFSTTVLERGITIKDVSIIILNHTKLFDESNIIQMLGRVDRAIDTTKGSCYIISDHYNKAINSSLDYLRKANMSP